MNAPVDTGAMARQIARARRPEAEHRRTGSKVRKFSRPRGAGRAVLLTWAEANERMRAIERWDRRQAKRERTRNRAVGYIGIELYRYLCREAVKRRGQLGDLAYGTIAGVLGFSRSAVVAAAARLKRFGWLDWDRQFAPTGDKGQRGPQVEQAPNFFRVLAPLKALLDIGIRFGPAPPPDDHDQAAKAGQAANKAAEFADSRLGESVALLEAAIRRKRETS